MVAQERDVWPAGSVVFAFEARDGIRHAGKIFWAGKCREDGGKLGNIDVRSGEKLANLIEFD